MKNFKFALVLITVLFTLSACKKAEPPVEPAKSVMPPENLSHIGCQEQEIDQDGRCVPAIVNNSSLFGQYLEPFVDSSMIAENNLGFLAKPKTPGTYPGVVMIHEWWGLNDNIKEMAKLLAKEGFVVLAVDMYNGQVAADSTKAGELAGAVRANPAAAVERLKQAANYLRQTERVTKLASLGWCFGGAQSLQLALNDTLDATVIYYGQLTDDKTKLANIKWPVLGIFGDKDTGIPVSSVQNFQSALGELGINNQIQIYPGVGHAFANPSGSNYAATETMDAWAKTLSFLSSNLKSEPASDPLPVVEPVSPIVTFRLSGEPFKFLMGGKEAPELRVRQGDIVRIEFTNTKGFHDWVLDEFNARTPQIQEGASATVEFKADKQGTFEYYCSVGNHRAMGMKGKFVVE